VATIQDVARLAGVSATTAKRAIRAPEKLAAETLERVRGAIDALHYEPDQLASALRSGRTTTIGLIIGSIVEPFFAALTRTIVHEVRRRGYSVIMADNEYRSDVEAAQLHTFHGNRVSGLILRSGYGAGNLDYLARMRARGISIVEIDYVFPGSPLPHVMLDNRGAVEAGVAHLVAHGHRRIAPLGSYHSELNPDERVQAFPGALARHGLSLPPAFVRPVSPTEWDARALTFDLMRSDEPPTALFAVTGSMATGAYRALKDLGLRVPDDVSVLAFDDYPWMDLVSPGVDTLVQPIERRRFPAELRVRGSVAAPA
jgi:LacI family transcriptional regulator